MTFTDRLFGQLRERLTRGAPAVPGREEYLMGVDDGLAASQRLCERLLDLETSETVLEPISDIDLLLRYVEFEIESLLELVRAALDTFEAPPSTGELDLVGLERLLSVETMLSSARSRAQQSWQGRADET